jgi:hypothetical protein
MPSILLTESSNVSDFNADDLQFFDKNDKIVEFSAMFYEEPLSRMVVAHDKRFYTKDKSVIERLLTKYEYAHRSYACYH